MCPESTAASVDNYYNFFGELVASVKFANGVTFDEISAIELCYYSLIKGVTTPASFV